MTTQKDPTEVNRIVIAVHGIGDQVRNATAQDVASMFGAGVIPLGAFPERIDEAADDFDVKTIEPAKAFWRPTWQIKDQAWRLDWLEAGTGFAEVYWADIPRKIANAGYTVQETKSWGRTVVERLRAHDLRRDPQSMDDEEHVKKIIASLQKRHETSDQGKRERDKIDFAPVDYDKASAALEEFIDAIRLVQSIGRIGKYIGLGSFDIGKVLNDYVNDVQVVAEFAECREDIVHRFLHILQKLHETHKGAEIHIVAHSEGTVVALLGLLHAYCRSPLFERSCAGPEGKKLDPEKAREWLGQVRSLMTIGSPIDKHFVMWPTLWPVAKSGPFPGEWGTLTDGTQKWFALKEPIPWFNYYDNGDPVGFELDTARDTLGSVGLVTGSDAHEDQQRALLKFPDANDVGFTRYPLPGKAHNDYFNDTAVFAHFSQHIKNTREGKPLKSLAWAWIVSRICPYLVAFAILATGVWVLHKNVVPLTLLKEDPTVWRNVAALTFLLAGMTVVTRLARLTRGKHSLLGGWHALGFLIYLLFAGAFIVSATPALKEHMGSGIVDWSGNQSELRPEILRTVRWIVVGLSVVAAFVVLRFDELKRRGMRRHCFVAAAAFVVWLFIMSGRPASWGLFLGSLGVCVVSWVMAFALPRRGILMLLFYGALLAALSISGCLRHLSPDNTPSFWPVALASAGFLYLWWLAAVMFDLTFMWHRYICADEAMRQLRSVGKIRDELRT
jgi:hypothetical protein